MPKHNVSDLLSEDQFIAVSRLLSGEATAAIVLYEVDGRECFIPFTGSVAHRVGLCERYRQFVTALETREVLNDSEHLFQ